MIEPNSRGALDNFHTRERGAIDAAATAAMRASFDLLIMTLLLMGSKQRLAAIVDLQANLESQRLTPCPRRTLTSTSAHYSAGGASHFLGCQSVARSRTDRELS
jgi:hypothetical protein